MCNKAPHDIVQERRDILNLELYLICLKQCLQNYGEILKLQILRGTISCGTIASDVDHKLLSEGVDLKFGK
ncbi:hypothetical protein H5410_050363 [Solanum commersonii]|uniref:Uncharacterized protein n=1 Tax=Solanum commersonii TaxID=4109 RepID=A0A9J5WXN4_SOLCO|nr:hypothetical protein H5410_050363 [Solanum commersonii]